MAVVFSTTSEFSSTAGDVTIGSRVEVRILYLQTWCRGFQVVAVVADGFLVRRLSDGFILPRCFTQESIRAC